MSCLFSLEAECLRLRLPAGAKLLCRSGSLWLTFELPDRQSPDILLAPGDGYRMARDADVFFATLHGAGPVVFSIDEPPRRRWPDWRWIRGLAGFRGFRGFPFFRRLQDEMS